MQRELAALLTECLSRKVRPVRAQLLVCVQIRQLERYRTFGALATVVRGNPQVTLSASSPDARVGVSPGSTGRKPAGHGCIATLACPISVKEYSGGSCLEPGPRLSATSTQ